MGESEPSAANFDLAQFSEGNLCAVCNFLARKVLTICETAKNTGGLPLDHLGLPQNLHLGQNAPKLVRICGPRPS